MTHLSRPRCFSARVDSLVAMDLDGSLLLRVPGASRERLPRVVRIVLLQAVDSAARELIDDGARRTAGDGSECQDRCFAFCVWEPGTTGPRNGSNAGLSRRAMVCDCAASTLERRHVILAWWVGPDQTFFSLLVSCYILMSLVLLLKNGACSLVTMAKQLRGP